MRKKAKFCVLPHPHLDAANMEPCRACGEKSICYTPQAQKNKATAKSNQIHKPSCGTPRAATPTQRAQMVPIKNIEINKL
ncbi:MAG: hypothetical protein NWE98_04400 [Candidatus Bathyarchaeota archaeon]|nr:hypothetical protein [Candidatus Bathyarchaeota archaeon]